MGLAVRRCLTLIIKWMQFQTCFAKWLEEDLQSPRAIVHIGRLSLQQSVELINNNSTRVQDMLATNELWPIDEENVKRDLHLIVVRTHAFWWNSKESTKTGLDLLKNFSDVCDDANGKKTPPNHHRETLRCWIIALTWCTRRGPGHRA